MRKPKKPPPPPPPPLPPIKPKPVPDIAGEVLNAVPDGSVQEVDRLHYALRTVANESTKDKLVIEAVARLLLSREPQAQRLLKGRIAALETAQSSKVDDLQDQEDDAKGKNGAAEVGGTMTVKKEKGPDAKDTKGTVQSKAPTPTASGPHAHGSTNGEPTPREYDTIRLLKIIIHGHDVEEEARKAKTGNDKTTGNGHTAGKSQGHKRARSLEEFLLPAKKPKTEPRYVDDWKCGLCASWNLGIHKKCRGKNLSDSEPTCPGVRGKNACETQADDGKKSCFNYNGKGRRHGGDWLCDECGFWWYHFKKHCNGCGAEKAFAMGFRLPFEGYPEAAQSGPDEKTRLSREMAARGKKFKKAGGWHYWDDGRM